MKVELTVSSGYLTEGEFGVFIESAEDASEGKTVVVIEVFVFDGDGGLDEVIGELVEFDGDAVLISIDFVK